MITTFQTRCTGIALRAAITVILVACSSICTAGVAYPSTRPATNPSAHVEVWVESLQDAFRGRQPAVIRVHRDPAGPEPLTVYFTLAGPAVVGKVVDRAKRKYDPPNADYGLSENVRHVEGDIYAVIIPVDAEHVDFECKPFLIWASEDAPRPINVTIVPPPAPTTGPATRPTTRPAAAHGSE